MTAVLEPRLPARSLGGAPLRVLLILGRRGYVVAEALAAADVITAPARVAASRTRLTFVPELLRQWKVLVVRGADVVLTDSVETAPVAAAVATLQRAPLVVRVRGDAWAEVEQGAERGTAMRMPGVRALLSQYESVLRRAAYVVPVSRYLADRVRAATQIPDARVVPIPMSVQVPMPTREQREEGRRVHQWGDDEIVLSVTNFRFPAKTIALEQAALPMRQALEARPSLRWVIAGDGPARSAFAARLRQMLGPVASRAIVAGQVTRMPLAYAACDAVAHFSGLDALPRAVIEAQASGCAVIANRVGGVPELIEDGVTGILVDRVDRIAEVVVRLLDDRAEAARLGLAARAHVAERFAPAAIGRQWASVLRQATNRCAA